MGKASHSGKGKGAREMTTEEAVSRLFPPKVIEEAKHEAHKRDDLPAKPRKPSKGTRKH